MSPISRIFVALAALAGLVQLAGAQVGDAVPNDPWQQHTQPAAERYAQRDEAYPQRNGNPEPGRLAQPAVGRAHSLVHFEKSKSSARDRNVRPAAAQERVAEEPIPLVPGKSETTPKLALRDRSSRSERPAGDTFSSLLTMAASLAVVLGLFLVTAWMFRRGMPKSLALLPSDVVEVLGRSPLASRQQMHLVRCGNKLLLVCATVGGIETLTEITDPVEVDRLSGLCQQSRPGSSTKAFQQVLQQFGAEKTSGFAAQQYRDRIDLSSFANIGGARGRDTDV
jgi:flagellar biogenesis protein FliO